MLFPTAIFAVFFFAVFCLTWTLKDRALSRKLVLLTASYVFYGWWDVRFIALLGASAIINYLCGYYIGTAAPGRARKLVLAIGILANVAVLGFFKYYNFFLSGFRDMMTTIGLERELPFMDIVLPVGISFYTFQGISYVVDVYRREVKPSRSLFDVMLYISFFPQLVAGPIVRAADFMPQLNKPARLNYAMVNLGFLLILIGLLKKMVLANYLATDIVDQVFFDPAVHSGTDLMVSLYAYTVQIYCDFSAYSDLAVGVALLLGYRFNVNFDQPYRAASVSEYWRRWHISLSTWLRDYFFRPLRGAHRGRLRTMAIAFLTMFVCGLWHGAAWTFVAWGTMHGLWLLLERIVGWGKTPAKTWATWIPGFIVAFHFVTLSRIYFRSENIDLANQYWAAIADPAKWMQAATLTTPFVILVILAGMTFHVFPNRTAVIGEKVLTRLPWPVVGLLFGLGLVIIDAIGPGGVTPFIYFQF